LFSIWLKANSRRISETRLLSERDLDDDGMKPAKKAIAATIRMITKRVAIEDDGLLLLPGSGPRPLGPGSARGLPGPRTGSISAIARMSDDQALLSSAETACSSGSNGFKST